MFDVSRLSNDYSSARAAGPRVPGNPNHCLNGKNLDGYLLYILKINIELTSTHIHTQMNIQVRYIH